MKNKLIFFLFIFFLCSIYAQQDTLFNKASININGKQLLMMGEIHHIKDFYDIQYRIIEHTILQNPEIKNFQLLLEHGPYFNYYLDKLTCEHDSVSLKELLRHFSYINVSHGIQDTLCHLHQVHYDFFMKLYYLSNSLGNRTFRFNCFENSHLLIPLTYTILDILKQYTAPDSLFLAQITFLNSILHDKFLQIKFNALHQDFGSYFSENRAILQELLTPTDFYYISEMLRRLQPMPFITQKRENMLFEHINNSYNDSTFFFCITGAGHIRKPYHTSELITILKKNGATQSITLIEMLEQYETSHFKDKMVLCTFALLSIQPRYNFQKDGTRKIPMDYPPALRKRRDYLNSLLTGNITLINMRDTKIKGAHKITDYMLVVKQGKSALW